MKAEDILELSGPAGAGKLMPGGPDEIRRTFRKLVALWHPDHNPDPRAAAVFRHLVALRDLALGRSGAGRTGQTGAGQEEILTARDGRRFRTRVHYRHEGDAGTLLVGARAISHMIPGGNRDLARLEEDAVRGFRFADADMAAQMAWALPALLEVRALRDDATLLIYERPEGEVVLADLLDAFGPLPPEHAAWLGSGLFNLAAWLSWAGLFHGGIGPDSVLVNPDTHSVRLVGGWAFSGRLGSRPAALPNRTLDLMPALAVKGAVAEESLQLELIRRTILESLGDGVGAHLGRIGVPAPLADFLRLPSAADGISDYRAWQEALVRAWGPRRFVAYPHRLSR
ncbi:hypothetical protein [Rhodovulum sp. YEN HP10]|uniref:hypothetical protein n=1 Tax=Rhodovulum sp. HP10 TaxID=3387397 RepID=UPI0039E07425